MREHSFTFFLVVWCSVIFVTPLSRCLIIAVILISPAPVPVFYVVQYTWFGTPNKVLRIFIASFIFLCYLITFVSYFKVYRIIRQHQQQVQGNQSSQNFGRPAINLAKYKRSVKSILCSFAYFRSLCLQWVWH